MCNSGRQGLLDELGQARTWSSRVLNRSMISLQCPQEPLLWSPYGPLAHMTYGFILILGFAAILVASYFAMAPDRSKFYWPIAIIAVAGIPLFLFVLFLVIIPCFVYIWSYLEPLVVNPETDVNFLDKTKVNTTVQESMRLGIRRALARVYSVNPKFVKACDTRWTLCRYACVPLLIEFVYEVVIELELNIQPDDLLDRIVAERNLAPKNVAELVSEFLCAIEHETHMSNDQ